jgi:PAS domain S-box-containing protein
MSESNERKTPRETKIIVGAECSDKTGWYSLHLKDAQYAISIRPDERRIVIDEGCGRGRLQYTRLPFDNVLRLEAVTVPISIENPVGNSDVAETAHFSGAAQAFEPVMVRLLIKHTKRNDFISIHDVGATPLLMCDSKAGKGNANTPEWRSSSNGHDNSLPEAIIHWVREVNAVIKAVGQADSQQQDVGPAAYRRLENQCGHLNLNEIDVQQSFVSACAALSMAVYFAKYRRRKGLVKLSRATNIESSFPLTLFPDETTQELNRYLGIHDLYEASLNYHKETGRPIEEAITIIAEHVSDLEERRVTIDSSENLSFLENNAPRQFRITDPALMINARERVISGIELQHEHQLKKVFEKEGIEVHYLKDLPFLSLLVKYETEDKVTHHAVVIKKGLHQALSEFLLAHELGHWFLHIKNSERAIEVRRFLRSSGRETFLEKEADSFGVSVLFPPSYLADWLFLKRTELSVDALLEEFVTEMEPVSDRLKDEMKRYIRELLFRYEEFKKDKEPSFLNIEVESIEEDKVATLLALIHQGNDSAYWVRLADDAKIMDASDNCSELFGLSKERLKGTTPFELIIPDEKSRMELRAKYRKESKRAIYYFTEVTNKTLQKTHPVMVYSFPVLKQGNYAGAMAAIRILDGEEYENAQQE